jgi:predicted alpha/beta hydrolase family esterase
MNVSSRFFAQVLSGACVFSFATFLAKPVEALAIKVEHAGETFQLEVQTSPGVAPKGVAVLVHGFGRSAKHMQAQAARMQELGYATVLPSVSIPQAIKSTSGAVFAKAFSQLSEVPEYAELVKLPKIVMGHSAGSIWATHFAAERTKMGDTIRGIILADPVVRADQQPEFVKALQPLTKLALFAPPSKCNAKNGAKADVLQMPESFLGLHLKKGSHCDIEAQSTDVLCTTFCGKSSAVVVKRVGDIVSEWSNALFDENTQSSFLPGGTEYEALISSGEAVALTKN